jgi:hypothetical protein
MYKPARSSTLRCGVPPVRLSSLRSQKFQNSDAAVFFSRKRTRRVDLPAFKRRDRMPARGWITLFAMKIDQAAIGER